MDFQRMIWHLTRCFGADDPLNFGRATTVLLPTWKPFGEAPEVPTIRKTNPQRCQLHKRLNFWHLLNIISMTSFNSPETWTWPKKSSKNFDLKIHYQKLLPTQHWCLKTTRKVSFWRVKRATLISGKTFGYTFWPLMNSCKFLVSLGIYSIKESPRIWKNF